jgi:hypothetical protein
MRPSLPLCWEFHLQAFLTLPAGWFGRGRILAKPNDCKNLRPIERSSADHRWRIVQNASYVCGSQRLCLSACGFCWHGRSLAVDPDAQSASPTEPAFVARLIGASVYHGFVVLDDVTSEGFQPWQGHRFRGRTVRRGRCLLNRTGRKSGRHRLGPLYHPSQNLEFPIQVHTKASGKNPDSQLAPFSGREAAFPPEVAARRNWPRQPSAAQPTGSLGAGTSPAARRYIGFRTLKLNGFGKA